MLGLKVFYINNKKSFEFALHKIRNDGYTNKVIRKKNGSERNLNIPDKYVKNIQKKLNNLLQVLYRPPKSVHGFICKNKDETRSIISNAKLHVNKKIVINIDIENFFGTINFGRVRGMFLSKPFSLDSKNATKLAQLVSFNNELPQGAPTSPVISNIICLRMDHELIALAKEHGLTYSRYADDITLSSNNLKLDFPEIVRKAEDIIESNYFKLNKKKTRFQYFYKSQVVTGIKVNKKINIDRKYARQIRSMLFAWWKDGLDMASFWHFAKYNKQKVKYISEKKSESFKKIVFGKINFLGQIKGPNDVLYQKLLQTYYLLESDFSLTKHLGYEKLSLNHASEHEIRRIFTQFYDSVLVITEGVTDVIYIKEALKYFKDRGQYQKLYLRFCTMGGWADIKKLHEILYKKNLGNNVDAILARDQFRVFMQKNIKLCFVLDADENSIITYFKHQPHRNYFLIEEMTKGYIEKLFDKNLIIDIVKNNGYTIDCNRKELSEDTKKSLSEYISDAKASSDEFYALPKTSYIAHKNKILEKTTIAEHISKNKNVNYDKFTDLFNFLSTAEVCTGFELS